LRLPPLKGVILWVGVAYPKYGKQLDLTRETMKGLLSPFSFKARSPGEGSPKKPALITRFIDSDWEILALGSNGYTWGCGVGGRSFCQPLVAGDTVQVLLDVPGRSLSFGVNGAPFQVAASRLHERGASPRMHGIVYLTDISAPMEGVAPVDAEVAVCPVQPSSTRVSPHSAGRKSSYGSPKYTHDYDDYGK